MQDNSLNNNQMTPIKQQGKSSQNDENSNSLPLQMNAAGGNGMLNGLASSSILLGNSSTNTNLLSSKALNAHYKMNENQSDTIFCPMNDPIFQPTPSPNVFMDYKSGNNNNNPYFNSSFKASGMLASTKKPYNNNLFLTPIKEDDRRKPAYINSILKESPYFNGNNICRKLNFDDDFEDLSGNNFMPQTGIFEEKKGVFSNFNMNYLMMPQGQYYHPFYNPHIDFLNASINNMDFQGMALPKNFMTPQGNESPENKKLANGNQGNNPQESIQNIRQPDLDGNSKKNAKQSKEESDRNNGKPESTTDYGNNLFTQQGNSKKVLPGHGNIGQQTNSQSNQGITPTAAATTGGNNASSSANQGNGNSGGNTNIQTSMFSSNSKKQKTCNCKKTKCLKLYCDCFAAGELCGGECNCFGCFNTSNSEKRAGAIVSIMDRLPDAFGPKVQQNTHKKGCNCARSGCLKKYCECFTLGINCGEYCKCTQCKNINLNHTERLAKAQNSNGLPPTGGIEITTKGAAADRRQQQLDELENKSSMKKKIFSGYQNTKLQKNTSSSNNEEDEDEEHDEEMQDIDEEEEEVEHNHTEQVKSNKPPHHNKKNKMQEEEENNNQDEDEAEQQEGEEEEEDNEQISPSQKMYTTPLKQPTKSDQRHLTTADTAKKNQGNNNLDNDSEIKNRIVKLKITDTQSQKKKQQPKSDKQNLQNNQSDSIRSNGSDEENHHINGGSNSAEFVNFKNKQTTNNSKNIKISTKQ